MVAPGASIHDVLEGDILLVGPGGGDTPDAVGSGMQTDTCLLRHVLVGKEDDLPEPTRDSVSVDLPLVVGFVCDEELRPLTSLCLGGLEVVPQGSDWA